jgi:hypothetical protein
VNIFKQEVQERITPQLEITADVKETQNVKVVRIIVPRGTQTPYAMDENEIFIRGEAETTIAVRDEIVELTKRGLRGGSPAPRRRVKTRAPKPATEEPRGQTPLSVDPPQTGVEIAEITTRNNTRYYTMRDLRNGSLVNNVTRRSARHLWRYAIEEAETNPVDVSKVRWFEDIGIWRQREYRNRIRWDLVQKDNGNLHVYYGVTDEGIQGKWATLVGEE